MSKVIYYVASTLDGYIATKDHTLEWLENFDVGDDASSYEDFYQKIGAIVMGSKTYKWILDNCPGEWPYVDIPTFIITTENLAKPPHENIQFVQDSAHDLAKKAKDSANGKDVWIVGGGKTAAYFANSRVLDQLFITIIPVFLGNGIPLIPVENKLRTKLLSHRILRSGVIEYIYDVKI